MHCDISGLASAGGEMIGIPRVKILIDYTIQYFTFIKMTHLKTVKIPELLGFYIENVLSEVECDEIINFVSNNMEDVKTDKVYRDMQQSSFFSDDLADKIWTRIKLNINSVTIDNNNAHLHSSSFGICGKWKCIGLNNFWRCSRYNEKGHFALHRDGYYQPDLEKRSLYTFMIYLNDDYDGGETSFVSDKICSVDSDIEFKFKKGTAIIFPHNYLHKGCSIKNGVKYILRSEIMFKNTRIYTKEEQEAFLLVQSAAKIEKDDPAKAVTMYKKAFRLCPDIENYT